MYILPSPKIDSARRDKDSKDLIKTTIILEKNKRKSAN
jgi:hypothetical protein